MNMGDLITIIDLVASKAAQLASLLFSQLLQFLSSKSNWVASGCFVTA